MSRTRAVRTAVVLTALACALALGGCSDDPEPKFAVPSETTTAPTPTASESANGPAEPTLDETGAAEFVDAWFGALSEAMVTGDVSEVEALSTRTCKSCGALAEHIESVYGNGGSFETKGWAVEKAELVGEFAIQRSVFVLQVREAKRTLREGDRVVDRTPTTRTPMTMVLTGRSGVWRTKRLVIVE